MNEHYLIPLLISGSLLITLFGFYLTIFMIIQKNKDRRYQLEKREIEYRYENELLHTRLEVQEQALNQVSQEIHDNIGQVLGAAQMNLFAVTSNHYDMSKCTEFIEDSKSLLAKAIDDLRNVSHVLNSEFINRIGLEDAIRKELAYISSFHKVQHEVTIRGDSFDLSKEEELLIFRIVQEALNNIAKHAQATYVHIELNYEPTNFVLHITDNGIGFDTSVPKKNSGIGLINMWQRAKLINGKLEINSAPAKGTKISLFVNTPS